MKTIILTGFDDEMRDVGDLTVSSKALYASKHGYDFKLVRQYRADSSPSWQKTGNVISLLNEGYDRVMWLDADSLVTNPNLTFQNEMNPIVASLDWGMDAKNDGHFSMGNFIVNNCPKAMSILHETIGKARMWANERTWEQAAIREVYVSRSGDGFTTLPRRDLNAVPKELAPRAPEPWVRGDFLCHLTGDIASNENRISLLKEKFKL